MPPRHAYWTIIVDDQPTSFRAHDVEELLPTFNRLREKHPNAQLKWFERGRLWESRDAAREQGFGQGERRWEGPRPSKEGETEEPRRDATWRPGGDHRDPRQKYKDAKKAKWDRYKKNIRARWEETQQRPRPDEGEFTPPHGDPMRPKVAGRGSPRPEWRHGDRHGDQGERGWRDRDERPRQAREDRAPDPRNERFREGRGDEGRGDRPEGRGRDEWRPREGRGDEDRPRERTEGGRKPWGSRSGGDRAQQRPWAGNRPSGSARKPWGGTSGGAGGRKPWGAKGADAGERKPWGDKPSGDRRRPWGSKPAGESRRPWGDNPPGEGRKPWGAKPAGEGRKPWGAKPAGEGRKPWGAKPAGEARKPWSGKPSGGARKSWGSKPAGGGFRKKPFGAGPPRAPRKKRREEDE